MLTVMVGEHLEKGLNAVLDESAEAAVDQSVARGGELVGMLIEASTKVAQQARAIEGFQVLANKAEQEKGELHAQVKALNARLKALEKESGGLKKQVNELTNDRGAFVQEAVQKVLKTQGFSDLMAKACEGFRELGRHEGLFIAQAFHPEVDPTKLPGYLPTCYSRANNTFTQTVLEFDGQLSLLEHIKASPKMTLEALKDCPDDYNKHLVVENEVARSDAYFKASVAKSLNFAPVVTPSAEGPSEQSPAGGSEQVGTPDEASA